MFTNRSKERRLSSGQKPASLAGRGAASAVLDGQESSWIGLLSVVSRPALSFLQKYVTGRPSAPSEREADWIRGELKRGFLDGDREFLRRLDDILPAPQLAYLRCQHDAGAGGPQEQRPGGPAPWLSAQSLQELEELGCSPRTFLGHVAWRSCPEVRPTAGREWRTRWSSLLFGLSGAEEATVTGGLCPQQAVAQTKAGESTTVFVQNCNKASTLGENTGPTHNIQNAGGSTPDHRLGICCEVVLLSPDHDNGYSSLEEEHVLISHLYVSTASGEESAAASQTPMEEDESERDSTSEKLDKEEEPLPGQEAPSGLEMLPCTPQCQNKAIAYIMGCPCSDDESSQSGEESSDDDDDGFDSEGSSDLSESTDEDKDEDSERETDSEAEHLWRSWCHNLDPYNPQNFTASLHTGRTVPRPIPAPSTPPPSSQSTPTSSPPCASDAWDDSTSASEVDEAESLRLWSSFSCSSDPYSPFNFQAPLRTQGPSEAAWAKSKSKKASHCVLHSPHHKAASPPEYRKEEAEERLDSGFSEHSSSSSASQSGAPTKKVRFSDDVEEFFASCGEEDEDRRGPWEELARDRCRFLRRCQEVEQSIAYCLAPRHRSLVYQRLTGGVL